MNETIAYLKANDERFLEELMELLRIPSISADSRHKDDMMKCAKRLEEHLHAAGITETKIYPTAGHPILYGSYHHSDDAPTVLVYGHYDVQPPDPLDLWDSPPFEPVIKKTDIHPQGAIFARGSCDDKGQLFMHVKALEGMIKTGSITCNVKVLFEGEEEIGSDHLETFVAEYKDLLKNDVIVISDTSVWANDVPTITSGLRGLSYIEVEVTGSVKDLHSGTYGGAVANPINVLCKMIADLHDENKHITIPGFYDDVQELSAEERKLMNEIPFDEEEYKASLKVDDLMGEKGYTTVERASIRPTLDVNGIWGGYIGEGAKTVLPSKAYAKISMRLVPDQDPDKATEMIKNHLESVAPKSVKVVVSPHHGGYPAVTPTDSVEYRAAEKAMEKTYGKRPLPVRAGGSIPIVAMFKRILGSNTVLMGFGLDSDDIHSPNEHYGLFNFYKGIETIPFFYHYYSELT